MTLHTFHHATLAKQAKADADAVNTLSKTVIDIAERQGFQRAEACYNDRFENQGAVAALEFVLQDLIQGADDGWSGRTNDVRRAYFDGKRNFYRSVQYSLPRMIRALVVTTEEN